MRVELPDEQLLGMEMGGAGGVPFSRDADIGWEGVMDFILTYEGPLRATQRDGTGVPSRHMANKRAIREAFHRQLKTLWEITPQLRGAGQLTYSYDVAPGDPPMEYRARLKEELAAQHQRYGHNFVPLVTEELDLLCSIDVLLLRPDRPGSVIWAGDIDNRLKTLLDALKIPDAGEKYATIPEAERLTPLFVLLEDDKLITKVSVETDRMLAPVTAAGDDGDVRLFVSVKVKPYAPTHWNAHFG
jgi:hypothetical protein